MGKDTAHIYNGIILTHKKNKVVPFTETPMGLETVIQSEKSERPKKKKKRFINTCMWNLENDGVSDAICKAEIKTLM